MVSDEECYPRPHYFYWLNYPVTEDEFSLLWTTMDADPYCKAARYIKHLAHKLVDATDELVRCAEKRRSERVLGRKLVERVWQ